ncbi:hypothetical protein [Brevibacillus migulae]|uniref:hypothetical protein n=1 Tax=Brevibacillus migulae TaxID=1644114 RepID=UPI00106F0463|nr:hypothetical protein [Brevibacillus migulae]
MKRMKENIMEITPIRCEVTYPQKGRGKRPITKKGNAVGVYANPYWHPYMYHAYHIVFDDGTKDTLHWKEVKFYK